MKIDEEIFSFSQRYRSLWTGRSAQSSPKEPRKNTNEVFEQKAKKLCENFLDLDNSSEDRAASLARLIDHTLLKADATRPQIEKVCQEANTYSFASVCVNSSWIETIAALLKSGTTLPIAVVGFPLGAMHSASKREETRIAIESGAKEIDMVLSVGLLKNDEVQKTFEDICVVVDQAGSIPVKLILETALLSNIEKIRACVLAAKAGVAFVKTSTGFSSGGATRADVELMRKVVGASIGVKASGGIKTLAQVTEMIQAGATRLGVSASVSILEELLTGRTTGPTSSGY